MASERNQKRIDVLTGRQVIVADGRSHRPIQVAEPASPVDAYDPFLEGNEQDTPDERLALRHDHTMANKSGWLLRVVPNRYPAVGNFHCPSLRSDGNPSNLTTTYNTTALSACPVVGEHDVVIECPDERSRLMQLSVIEITRILVAWQHRLRSLSSDTKISSVSIFRNEGFGAGASLAHCHSQILATDFISPQLMARINAERSFCEERTSNWMQAETLYEYWLNSEIKDGRRVVDSQDGIVVLCPFASRTPWQVRICPANADVVSFRFDELGVDQLVVLAARLLKCVTALECIREGVAFNLVMSLPPSGLPTSLPWMLDILPRPNRMAGFELMTDVDILAVSPENAAEQYRTNECWAMSTMSRSDLHPEGFTWRTPDAVANADWQAL